MLTRPYSLALYSVTLYSEAMDAPVKVIDGAQYRRHGEFVAIGPRRLLADALTGAPVLAAHIAQARSETTTSYLAAEARARAEENELSRDAQ